MPSLPYSCDSMTFNALFDASATPDAAIKPASCGEQAQVTVSLGYHLSTRGQIESPANQSTPTLIEFLQPGMGFEHTRIPRKSTRSTRKPTTLQVQKQVQQH